MDKPSHISDKPISRLTHNFNYMLEIATIS